MSNYQGPQLKLHLEEIQELYRNGILIGEIAKKFNCAKSSIYELLAKHGQKFKKINRYDVDLKFFDDINTEAKAYILGWWYSDGCVNNYSAKLAIGDKDILEQIRSLIKYTGPIYTNLREKTNRPFYTLSINKKEFRQGLINCGCVPQKSKIIDFPSKDIVSKSLIKHFIRGIFDGDGCISVSTPVFYICSASDKFIYGINDAIPYMHQKITKNNGMTFLKISKRAGIEKIYHWLYDDANFWLDRKRKKFIQYLGDC
jgi:hypothetical protein